MAVGVFWWLMGGGAVVRGAHRDLLVGGGGGGELLVLVVQHLQDVGDVERVLLLDRTMLLLLLLQFRFDLLVSGSASPDVELGVENLTLLEKR